MCEFVSVRLSVLTLQSLYPSRLEVVLSWAVLARQPASDFNDPTSPHTTFRQDGQQQGCLCRGGGKNAEALGQWVRGEWELRRVVDDGEEGGRPREQQGTRRPPLQGT